MSRSCGTPGRGEDMEVTALCSASGSPGVTTTALGMALLWPRPVLLIEADATGGSGILAGYFRGIKSYDQGLVELALAADDVADRSEEHTSELQSLMRNSYAVFCLTKNTKTYCSKQLR